MKLDCGPTQAEKIEAKKKWHRKFLFFPHRMTTNDRDCRIQNSHDCRWLEVVERRGTLHSGWGEICWTYEYRAIK
jgi:hypothetical protein